MKKQLSRHSGNGVDGDNREGKVPGWDIDELAKYAKIVDDFTP